MRVLFLCKKLLKKLVLIFDGVDFLRWRRRIILNKKSSKYIFKYKFRRENSEKEIICNFGVNIYII